MPSQFAQIDMSGPFFQKDVEKTLLENVQKMMEGLAQEGEDAARSNLLVNAGNRAPVRMTGDRVADHVIGRTVSLSGRQWLTAAVVQVTNKGLDAATSRSVMAAGSVLEGSYHPIRKVATQIRRSRAVLTANLSEGLE